MATLGAFGRRALLAGLFAVAGGIVLPKLANAASSAPAAKIGLIDLHLRPETLGGYAGVKIRHLSFWASGYGRPAKQSAAHRRDHGEVMARALIEAYQALSPSAALELFIASPFVENAEGRKLIDMEQLGFAFDWFASQGVKIVALTFVGRNSPGLAAAMDQAHRRGLVVLASAGNGPDENPVPAYPAAYGSVIAIGTTGLNAARAAEDARLTDVSLNTDGPVSRRGYVDYGVKAPQFTSAQARRDPDVTAMLGSSRATVVAAGVLAAAAHSRPVESVEDALTLLDSLAVPCDADVAARGMLDLTALQTSVRLMLPVTRPARDREAA
ncbi:MAG: hypothetical protein JNK21_01345 [Rhodospirillaceae bacterium]|nr:hypothetical protein [Rhodospirillaceae bacterium]